MPTVEVSAQNVDWMNDWFESGSGPPKFRTTFTRDKHKSDTNETATRLAALIKALDADVLAIEEGPSRQAELQLFIDTYLTENGQPIYDCFLGDTGATQKAGLLYKPGSVDSAELAPHADLEDLIDPWLADVDGYAILDLYHFTRTPLVVNLTIGGHPLQVIVMHTKSNFINNGEKLWKDPAQKQNYINAALKNRRWIGARLLRGALPRAQRHRHPHWLGLPAGVALHARAARRCGRRPLHGHLRRLRH
jgi:hypothetical protein